MSSRSWAIVTGAAGGMGAAFTRALAKRGYPVLAVARSAESLVTVANEIRKSGAFVETLAADLASAAGVAAGVEKAHSLGDTELLVNKAGLYAGSGVPGLAGRFLPFATPEEVVRAALAAYDSGRVVRVVGLTNRALAFSSALTPRFILRWLMARMFAPIAAAGSQPRSMSR